MSTYVDYAVRQFGYLLNALERAAQEENPAEHGYAEKRRAVLAYVRGLAKGCDFVASRPVPAGTDRTEKE